MGALQADRGCGETIRDLGEGQAIRPCAEGKLVGDSKLPVRRFCVARHGVSLRLVELRTFYLADVAHGAECRASGHRRVGA